MHYESLHPVERQDIEETIKLTKSYIATPSSYGQEYGFTRNDIAYLISQNMIKPAPKSLPMTLNDAPKAIPKCSKAAKDMEDNESFKLGDVCFKDLDNGKVRCGICQDEFTRLIVHMNVSKECKTYFQMAEFKTEYS